MICYLFFPGALSLAIWILRGKRDKAVVGLPPTLGLGMHESMQDGEHVVPQLLDAVGENMLSSYVKGLVCV